MSPYEKGFLFVLRILSICLILTSVILFGSYLFYMIAGKKTDDGLMGKILKSAPFFLGIFLAFKSGAIARWLSEKIEG